MKLRLALASAAATALLVAAVPATGGAGLNAYTVDPASAVRGTTTLITATLTDGTCSEDLRLQLLDQSDNVVTDNGNGGVTDATQIRLGLYEESTTNPPAGLYNLRVTCGGSQVGPLTPFTITEPQPAPTPEPAPEVVAEPTFTG
jgi:hypothetical protein